MPMKMLSESFDHISFQTNVRLDHLIIQLWSLVLPFSGVSEDEVYSTYRDVNPRIFTQQVTKQSSTYEVCERYPLQTPPESPQFWTWCIVLCSIYCTVHTSGPIWRSLWYRWARKEACAVINCWLLFCSICRGCSDDSIAITGVLPFTRACINGFMVTRPTQETPLIYFHHIVHAYQEGK